MDNPLSVEGVITRFRLVNPHAYVYFDVTDDSGAVANWRCELSGATGMKRRGWTADSLVPGQAIMVNGAPGRREDRVCYTNFMMLEDGTRIDRNSPPAGAAAAAPVADTPGLPAPTEAGVAAAADYEQPFDDPAIFCHPANIIFGFTHDSHVNDIYQTDDTVTLQYGYMDLVRAIHLDQAEHPDDIVPSVGGHSIGRWDGDVLVADTVGFEQGILFPLNGRTHSADMQVTERFAVRDEGQTLVRSYVAHDPAFLQTDWVGESVFRRTSEPYQPYDCTELSGDNNRRPAAE